MRPLTLLMLLVSAIGFAQSVSQKPAARLPGPVSASETLLPNGWTLSPAGDQIPVGDLPLAILLHPDGRHLLVENNGNGTQSLDVVDIQARRVVSRAAVESAWLGLGLSPDGRTVYAGGGMSNSILRFSLDAGRISAIESIPVDKPAAVAFTGGLCLTPQRLYVANNQSHDVAVVDLGKGRVTARVPVGDHPYTCLTSADGTTVFVSLWGAAQVAAIDAASLKVTRRFPTDDHPNAMALSKDGKRLFVANANANTISAIDLAAGTARERISVALYPDSPAGSTTNALAVSADGSRLYAANADNNDVAVIDITKAGESRVLGFIPVGWYPTALAVSADNRTLFVANGKGSRSMANVKGPLPIKRDTPETQYIGRLFLGTVSVVPVPDDSTLKRYTEQVYRNTPYTAKKLLAETLDTPNAIPKRVGDRSPIRYVIYVIKENRTYDQVFGDIPQGNGDPRLTLFGEDVTPNHHALAREFVLLDNFYANAEVSADGHNWSMGAYATDYVEKTWPSNYSGRRKPYEYEGGAAIVAPSAGYIWDACRRAKVSYRSYGEWVENGRRPGDPAKPTSPGLAGHIDPHYRGWDLDYSDVERTRRFLSELKRFESGGDMPQFQIVRLGADHTMGTRPGALTPSSYVAQNDLALGTLVEGVSRSRFWKETAIFVVEDDAQNGPDHVDAHRTVALVVSPYVRRNTVDSTLYSTVSMLRTMELILGLPPMSQHDAGATPMFASFGDKPDLKPYEARPARVSMTDINPPNAPGAARSMQMAFDEADEAPDVEFSEIIWKAVKGKDSVMPAPVRSAFVRPIKD